jgi:hypothetical protein
MIHTTYLTSSVVLTVSLRSEVELGKVRCLLFLRYGVATVVLASRASIQ